MAADARSKKAADVLRPFLYECSIVSLHGDVYLLRDCGQIQPVRLRGIHGQRIHEARRGVIPQAQLHPILTAGLGLADHSIAMANADFFLVFPGKVHAGNIHQFSGLQGGGLNTGAVFVAVDAELHFSQALAFQPVEIVNNPQIILQKSFGLFSPSHPHLLQ